MKMSDRLYYVKEYGIKKFYLVFCEFIKWVSLFSTLLLIPVSIGGVVYYTFVCYDVIRVICFSIILFVMVDTNKKL